MFIIKETNMSNIYQAPILITEQYLKQYSPIPNNFKWDDILPFIPIAEEVWVAPILGRKLYNELLTEVSENNVSGEHATLLLKIYPYLSMAIVYESMPFLAHHISEKGITAGHSDNSEPISSSELSNMQNHIRTQLEVLKKMLKQFLNEHKECFPSYDVDYSDCSCDNNDCDAFALFLWNSERIDVNNDRWLRYYNFYKELKHRPNSNVRLYSNKRLFPYL